MRAAFVLPPDSPVGAQRVFTNRLTEVQALDASLETMVRSLADPNYSPVTDRSLPRRNVLVFYGVGGIGKTTLSKELSRRWSEPDTSERGPRCAIRVDFADQQACDLETYVLRLRAGLVGLGNHWHAFDLAFRLYWDRAHPGEPLNEFIAHDSLLGRAGNALGLSDQMAASLTSLFDSTLFGGVGIARIAGTVLYRHARNVVRTHRSLQDCDRLQDLIDADADLEALSYMPYLLSWGLERINPRTVRAAVFLDTVETLAEPGRADFAGWLRRSVYLMPNVLFIVTGRNRLTWADDSPDMDWSGPERWPNLVAASDGTEPRQHLVGYLSESDADSYLQKVLVNGQGPVIAPEVRTAIVRASRGLPLYLDLAVTRYLHVLSRHGTPTAADFGPLPQIVFQTMRDLSGDERHLLRAAALLQRFDASILRGAWPIATDAAIERFCARPFVDSDPKQALPFSLHAVVADAVRGVDHELPDSWSARERALAASGAAAALQAMWVKAVDASDRSRAAQAFFAAVRLGATTGQFFEWIVTAAYDVVARGLWVEVQDPGPQTQGANRAVVLGLSAERKRRAGRIRESLAELDEALALVSVDSSMANLLQLLRGHALRVGGHFPDAARIYRRLARRSSFMRRESLYWCADFQYLIGNFAEAMKMTASMLATSDVLCGEAYRLRGHVLRVNGSFHEALDAYSRALDWARTKHDVLAEAKALTNVAETLCWLDPLPAIDASIEAEEMNRHVGNSVEVVKCLVASAIAHTRHDPLGLDPDLLTRLGAQVEQIGYPGGKVGYLVVRAYVAAVSADVGAFEGFLSELAEVTRNAGGHRFWVEIAHAWVDDPLPAAKEQAQWLDGTEETYRRWRSVVVP